MTSSEIAVFEFDENARELYIRTDSRTRESWCATRTLAHSKVAGEAKAPKSRFAKIRN